MLRTCGGREVRDYSVLQCGVHDGNVISITVSSVAQSTVSGQQNNNAFVVLYFKSEDKAHVVLLIVHQFRATCLQNTFIFPEPRPLIQ
jgi:hypothetical protein